MFQTAKSGRVIATTVALEQVEETRGAHPLS